MVTHTAILTGAKTCEVFSQGNFLYSDVTDYRGIYYRIILRNTRNFRMMEVNVESYSPYITFTYWVAAFKDENFSEENNYVGHSTVEYYPVYKHQ